MKDGKKISDYFEKGKRILIVLSIFAAVKMLFFAFGLDEEYQLVMAYRNVKGDKLFLDMWEPHQSSAFLCALLMRPYLALVGETGLVIWLRFCGTLIHLGVSCYLYQVLRRMISRDSAFLVGLIYFNTIPKQIMLPEFGIMQVWFLTLLSLFLIQYYDRSVSDINNVNNISNTSNISTVSDVRDVGNRNGFRKRIYLIAAAFALVLEILAYPSCLLLYFPVLWIIWRRSGKARFADMGILTGICAGCGILYLELLLQNNTVEGLLHTLSYIVNGDITHSLTLTDKLLSLGKEILIPLILYFVIYFLAKAGAELVVKRRKVKETGKETEKETKNRTGSEKERSERLRWELIWMAALACLTELVFWVILNAGYEAMQIHLVVFTVLGVQYYRHGKARYRTGKPDGKVRVDREDRKDQEDREDWRCLQKGLLLDGIILAGVALLAVLYLTDLGLMDSLPHAMSAAFLGMALVIMCWEEKGEKEEKNSGETDEMIRGRIFERGRNSVNCIYMVLTLWALTAIFGKGYSLRSGTGYHNVLQSGGILKYGPAAGTISDYMCAYIYNCDYEDWQNMIQDGDRVLIMVDQVMNLGTIQYLFKDVEISHYSIVNPTAYDERLPAYWEMFPEKKPNVIIVDDWYGQLMTDPEGWLMRYAEGEFGYTSVENGRYIRVYRND